MTKEEVIESMIESRKKGLSTLTWSYCLNMNCDDCPFHGGKPICSETMILMLVDRLVKAEEQSKSFEKTCYKLQQAIEEKKETNLEHYIDSYRVPLKDGDVPIINFKDGWYEKFKAKDGSLRKWLLSPYEETKYKLSQFEYDLLKAVNISLAFPSTGNVETCMEVMRDKGYFKDIPNDIRIKDILDNCEVVEE